MPASRWKHELLAGLLGRTPLMYVLFTSTIWVLWRRVVAQSRELQHAKRLLMRAEREARKQRHLAREAENEITVAAVGQQEAERWMAALREKLAAATARMRESASLAESKELECEALREQVDDLQAIQKEYEISIRIVARLQQELEARNKTCGDLASTIRELEEHQSTEDTIEELEARDLQLAELRQRLIDAERAQTSAETEAYRQAELLYMLLDDQSEALEEKQPDQDSREESEPMSRAVLSTMPTEPSGYTDDDDDEDVVSRTEDYETCASDLESDASLTSGRRPSLMEATHTAWRAGFRSGQNRQRHRLGRVTPRATS